LLTPTTPKRITDISLSLRTSAISGESVGGAIAARNSTILQRYLQADARFADAKKWALLGAWQ
jgi:hypothetical protein